MLHWIFAILVGGFSPSLPSSIVEAVGRAEVIAVAKVVRIEPSECAVYLSPVRFLKGGVLDDEFVVEDCGRISMTSSTLRPVPVMELGDEEIVFGVTEMGRLMTWSNRGVYWANGIYPDVEARIGHVEHVLALRDYSNRHPSDAFEIRRLLASRDDVLVGIGLDALFRDLSGKRELPHRELATLVLELATERKCCDESFLSDVILRTLTSYVDPRLGLDNDLHDQLDAQKKQRRAYQKAAFDAKVEVIKRSRLSPRQ